MGAADEGGLKLSCVFQILWVKAAAEIILHVLSTLDSLPGNIICECDLKLESLNFKGVGEAIPIPIEKGHLLLKECWLHMTELLLVENRKKNVLNKQDFGFLISWKFP